ncbi:hypothetical protein HGRIS_007048 [Hohenbuehelia grisea]|uniref:Uncharacterized protein n=1 Tax=Hohenbuehelia grisea TaxID=104357 RepID=A0ABR3JBL8_9AGAR
MVFRGTATKVPADIFQQSPTSSAYTPQTRRDYDNLKLQLATATLAHFFLHVYRSTTPAMMPTTTLTPIATPNLKKSLRANRGITRPTRTRNSQRD